MNSFFVFLSKYFLLLKPILPVLFFIFLTVAAFYKVVFLSEVFYYGDNFHLNIALKSILIDQILKGNFPLWNPYIFIGMPYLADLNLGTLFPLNFLYFIFSAPYALSLQAVLDIFLILVFMYLFLRSLNLNVYASVIGAVIFSFSGSIFPYINNITILNVILYIPIIFLLLNKLITTKKWIYLYLLIIAQSLQIISGHPQLTYYTILFGAMFLFSVKSLSFKTKFFVFMLYYIFSLMLSSIQLIPFLELVLNANRPTGLDYATSGSFSFLGFITFFLPTFFGNIADGNWWGSQQILTGYIGITSLFLLFIGVRNWKNKNKLFFLIALILAIILSLGKNSIFYNMFYYLIPGWKSFRNPSQLLVFYVFFASILSAGGMDYIVKEKFSLEKFISSIKKIIFLLVIVCFPGVLIYIYTDQNFFWPKIFENLSNKIRFMDRLLIYDNSKLQIMFQNIFLNFLFLVFLLFLSLIIFSKYRKTKAGILLIILITINLIYFDTKVLLTSKENLYKNMPKIPAVLDTKNNFRILSLPVNLHQGRIYMPGSDFFFREAKANLNVFNGDNNIANGIYQIRGYASMVPTAFAKYVDPNSAEENITGINLAISNKRVLNNASIKYVFTDEKLSVQEKDFTLIENIPNKYFLYLNNNVLPRAYLLEKDSKSFVKILENKNEYIKIKVKANKNNQLILADQFYPGWKAYVNKMEVPILPYLNTFRSVDINKGESNIVFEYKPQSFYLGLLVSTISFILLTMIIIFKRNSMLPFVKN